ncbi:WD40 repeat domain-containing protein [bacterium]|jgi:hypothetical protein|nr:WD40 repeat domain-containing protein [bacterium]MBT3903607.1 WD40 repeat domain-containing protein [bacterium]MBT4578174.1 WD40 repeat domain-containing protein [bacterium]MBT5345651.1 WD40 repeat domain-containing protein [bacterium]MBT6130662.1 WD40 repeat domain-containing protein [bacterium]
MKRLVALLVLILGQGYTILAVDDESSFVQNPLQQTLSLLGYQKSDVVLKGGRLVGKNRLDIRSKALSKVALEYVPYLGASHEQLFYCNYIKSRTPKWSPDSTQLAITPAAPKEWKHYEKDEGVGVYNLLTKKTVLLSCPDAGSLKHRNTAWSFDSKKIVADYNGSRGTMVIFDVNKAKLRCQLNYGNRFEDKIHALCWDKSGNTVAVINRDFSIGLWDANCGKKMKSLVSGFERIARLQGLAEPGSYSINIAYNPNDNNQLVMELGRTVSVLDVRSGKSIAYVNTVQEELKKNMQWAAELIKDSNNGFECNISELSHDGNTNAVVHSVSSKSFCCSDKKNIRLIPSNNKIVDLEHFKDIADDKGKVQSIQWSPDDTCLVVRVESEVHNGLERPTEEYEVYDLAGKLRGVEVENLLALSSLASNKDQNFKLVANKLKAVIDKPDKLDNLLAKKTKEMFG